MIAMLTSLLFLPTIQDVGPAAPAAHELAFERAANGVRVRVDRVPDVGAVSIWLCVRAGTDHDPADQGGLARVLAEVLREESPARQPDRPVETIVLGDATLIGVTGPVDLLEPQLERIARWLRGEVVLDDDTIERLRGRTLLRADDESSVLPGPILRDRVEAILLAGRPDARPSGGDPARLRDLSPAQVRAGFARAFHPERASVVVVGGVSEAVTASTVGSRLSAETARACPALPIVPGPAAAEAVERVTVDGRVDAPFVTFGIRAPAYGDAEFLPFLLAMEVARGRAAATFRTLRGGEVPAEFPWLSYDFTRMPHVAYFQRRGRNGDPVESVQAEIESLVAGLRGGAAEDELGAAVGVLLRTLELPPFSEPMRDALRRFPLLLHQRGAILALYEVHHWPKDLRAAIGSVIAGKVDEVLRDALRPDRGAYVALRPPG